jgi:hypothetical protein
MLQASCKNSEAFLGRMLATDPMQRFGANQRQACAVPRIFTIRLKLPVPRARSGAAASANQGGRDRAGVRVRLATEMPILRQTSSTDVPTSACFSAKSICSCAHLLRSTARAPFRSQSGAVISTSDRNEVLG